MTDDLPVSDLSGNPRALRVCKREILVQAAFADGPGVCETLEGPVGYDTGDAILTGVRGERWPVRRNLFLASYKPVPPAQAGENGSYRKIPVLTYALRLDRPCKVPAASYQPYSLSGQPGDWLLQYADRSYGIVKDYIFRESYLPAPDESRWPPDE